ERGEGAVAKAEKCEALHREGDRRQSIASREQKAAGDGQLAWSDPGEVDPAPGCRQPEAADGQAEGPRGLSVGPAELLDQKRLEVAPSVHGAKAELQYRAHGRN